MVSDINERMLELKERIAEKKRLEHILSRAYLKIEEEKASQEKLIKILLKEEKDVQRLESQTITSFFFETLGSKDQRLQKAVSYTHLTLPTN